VLILILILIRIGRDPRPGLRSYSMYVLICAILQPRQWVFGSDLASPSVGLTAAPKLIIFYSLTPLFCIFILILRNASLMALLHTITHPYEP
jgi:hypothetical protein